MRGPLWSQSKQGTVDGASGAPVRAREGPCAPGGGGLEHCCGVSSRGCMVAWLHRAPDGMCSTTQGGREDLLGRVGASSGPSGDGWPSCRTKAGAGLPWPWGRCGSPRTAGCEARVFGRDERGAKKQQRRKIKMGAGECSLMGTPRAVVGAAGAVVVGTLSGS